MAVPRLKSPLAAVPALVVLALACEGAHALVALAREVASRPDGARAQPLASGEARADRALGAAAAGWRAARARVPANAALWVAVPKTEAGLATYMRLVTLLFGRTLHLAPVPDGATIERPFAPSSVELWLLDLTGGRLVPQGARVADRGDGYVLWKL